jgi:hypothetical protein
MTAKLAKDFPLSLAELYVLEYVASDQFAWRGIRYAARILLELQDRGLVKAGPVSDGETAWVLTEDGRKALDRTP